MRSVGEFRLSNEAVMRAGLVVVLGLGGLACNGGRAERATSSHTATKEADSRCQPLRSFEIVKFRKDGGLRSKNVGECVDVLDTQKHKKIGNIAHGQSFVLLCDTTEYLRVETAGGDVGDVHYSKTVSEQFRHKSIPQVSHCTPQSPETSHK